MAVSTREQERRNEVLERARKDREWKNLTPDSQRRLTDAILNDRWPSLPPLT